MFQILMYCINPFKKLFDCFIILLINGIITILLIFIFNNKEDGLIAATL